MATKLGAKRNPKTTQYNGLKDIFTDIADPALVAAVYNCLNSGVMIALGMNRAQTGIKVTVYEGTERTGEWANDRDEFIALLADIAEVYNDKKPGKGNPKPS